MSELNESQSGRTLRELARIFLSHLPGMLVLAIAIFAATWALTVLLPAWYRSEVQLLASPTEAPGSQARTTPVRDEVSLFIPAQRELIESQFVLGMALMRLDGQEIGDANVDVPAWLREHPELARKAGERVSVVTPGGADETFTRTFKIRVDWPTEPDKAAAAGMEPGQYAARCAQDLASYVLEAYLERYSQIEARRTEYSSKLLLETSLSQAGKDLKKAEGDLNKLITEKIKDNLPLVVMMSPGSQAPGGTAGPASLSTDFQARLNLVEVDLERTQALKTELDEQLKKSDPITMAVPDLGPGANPLVAQLQSELVTLKLKINAMEEEFDNTYRVLADLKAAYAKAKNDLLAELKKQDEQLDQQIKVLQAQQAKLVQIRDGDRKSVGELAGLAAQYEQLRRARDAAQKVYDARREQALDAEAASELARRPPLVSVIDPPSYPNPADPRRPILWLNLLLGAIAALVVAVVYAFVADYYDHSIRSTGDAERHVGVPVLASVPRIRTRIIRA